MTAPIGQKPSRVRYGVLGFVCVLSAITYLDRACFPNVQGSILQALGKDNISQLKLALTAFQLAYALFEVPTGWLGDVFGPRKTLIRIVLWWSFFIALTGLVGRVSGVIAFGFTIPEFTLYGFWALVGIRFMFGIGEAGAYPNIARALYNWFPLAERGRASGIIWMMARLMGGLTPLIMTLLLVDSRLHWRSLFLIFGAAGVVWCVAFALWFRNRPEEKSSVNAAELKLISGDAAPAAGHSGIPWRKILTHRGVWALCLMYACTNYSWYFNMNYLPAFLENQYEVSRDPAQARLGAIYKGGPLLFGMAGCYLGGWLTDRYIRRTGDRKWGRRLFGMVGHGLAGFFLITCLFVPYQSRFAWLFALLIALSGFANDLTMAATWAACQDIGRRYSAIVSGIMNMIGNLGGALTTYVTGMILERYIESAAAVKNPVAVSLMARSADAIGLVGGGALGAARPPDLLGTAEKFVAMRPGWELNFVIYGVVYLVAVGFWMMLDAGKPVESDAAVSK